MLMDHSLKLWQYRHSSWRLNISSVLPGRFCLRLVELSADCVHSPTGLWLGSSLISNPVEVFPVFVRSLKQISWKYKLSHKPQDRKRRKMFLHMAGWRWGEAQAVIYTLLGWQCQKPLNNKNVYYVKGYWTTVLIHIFLSHNAVVDMSLWYTVKTASPVKMSWDEGVWSHLGWGKQFVNSTKNMQ